MSSRKLRQEVESFIDSVTARPSEAVGSSLDRLKQAVRDEDRGDTYGVISPVANETWYQTLTLAHDQASTPQNPMEIPYACKVVGCDVEILLVQFAQGIVEPPPEAIQIFLNIDRHENLTMRVDKNIPAQANPQVANIRAIDSANAHLRSFDLDFNKDDQNFSVQAFWAVDLSVVTAAGWGDVLLQFNWFVEPKYPGTSQTRR